MKKTIITTIVIIILIIIGLYYFTKGTPVPAPADQSSAATTNTSNTTNTNNNTNTQSATSNTAQTQTNTNGAITSIGQSVDGHDINAYHFGTGSTEILLVGGIHGGYEWNTALLAYQLINYLKSDASLIPNNVRVTIVPVLNPDGLRQVVGTSSGNFTIANVSSNAANVESGRFNSKSVDLNRNFDCQWKSTGVWQNKTVSGGTAAFSEPESLAMKNYIETNKPSAAVILYSAAGGVYASSCGNAVTAETSSILKAYAKASGYPSYESFDAYSTTGDMANWLASIDIPAISVLLTNHSDTELQKNESGLKALLQYYSK